jgi:tetratricopeptide (TPR) repeat protein
MGIVYRVYDRLTDQIVALKSVTTRMLQNASTPGLNTDNYRLALAREFRLLASLRHPNIISVLDYGFDAHRQPYFTMELLEGAVPITEYARKLSQEKQLDLLIQMLEALAYLHRQGIVHRDLKPDNVVVVSDRVKVLDFGLAAAVGQIAAEDSAAGTLAYLAPEVLIGSQPTAASDLHAVGVIAYEIFAGEHPFRGVTNIDTVRRIMTQEADTEMLPLRRSVREPLAKLLAKTPEERFQNANEIIRFYNINTGRSEAVPVRESFLRAAQFVGRKAELEQLKAALRRILADADRPRIIGSSWLIVGESGVGKSRLLDELRAVALVEGVVVLRGQTSSEGAAPFDLWRSVVRHLCLHVELDDEDAAALREILPDLEVLLGRMIPQMPPTDPRSTRGRLVSIIERMFQRLQTPMLLLLEDLQWADEDLDVLQSLLKFAGDLPLLIVASYRSDEAPDLPQRLPEANLLPLQRLNAAEISELSISMMGDGGRRAEVLDLVQRESEGNVFFVVEVVRALAEDAGSMDAIGLTTLPPGVLAAGMAKIIQRRLSRVPQHWRETLELVAIIGRVLDLDVLVHLIDESRSVELFLQTCQALSLLEVHEEQWRFSHDKLREQLLLDLPAQVRSERYLRAAQAVARVHADDPQHAGRLAYLWQQSGNRQQEAQYSVIAGAHALRYGLYPQARNWLERAEMLEKQGIPVIGSVLWQHLGEVHYNLGNYQRARELLEESVRRAQAAGAPEESAHSYNLLGNIALALGNTALAREHLQQGLIFSQQAHDTLETARILRSLGVVQETDVDYSAAQRSYREALQRFQEIGDGLGIAGTYSNLASITRLQGDLSAARQLFQQALAGFEALHFAWGTAFTLTNLALTEGTLGETLAAYEHHERAVTICRSIGHRWGTAFCLANLARTALEHGDDIRVGAALREAFAIAQEIHTEPLQAEIMMIYGCLLLMQQRPDEGYAVLHFVMRHPASETILRQEIQAITGYAGYAEAHPLSTLTIDQLAQKIHTL